MQTDIKIDLRNQRRVTFADRLRKIMLVERLMNIQGALMLIAGALIISAITVCYGYTSSVLILIFLVGLPLTLAVIRYPKFGIMILLTGAYLIMWVNRMAGDYPLGTLMDALEGLLILGFFFKHKYDRSWAFVKSPISIMIVLWLLYNFLEVINPIAESRMAWVFTVRTVGIVMLTYFIFMYYIRSISFIRSILKVWLALSLFAALYALKQEYFDFFPFEKQWLASNPVASSLYFIGGHWRKFSIFSDPVASAYNMVMSSLLCITLMFGPLSFLKKVLLGILTMIFILAMLYSGTRGAFVLLPAGLALLVILKLNRLTFILGGILAVLFIGLIKVPTSNPTLNRFQTAFRPSDDPSFLVRKNNQKKIQPYIQTHPMGGGLGSTGTWGQRFSPNSYLASFPPDSGYVRVAVEMGWVGLLLLCALMFVILRTGIINYFKIQNPELKNYCLAMILIVFALSIGNYPQEALVQFPVNIYFYLVVALINITLRIDQELAKNIENETNPAVI